MDRERSRVKSLLKRLNKASTIPFPDKGRPVQAPDEQGVYILRNRNRRVMHVGRTVRGKNGLRQRLNNHLRGQSSFVQGVFGGKGSKLRLGCTYQYLVVKSDRVRVLLEYAATVEYCPKHLGVGKKAGQKEVP